MALCKSLVLAALFAGCCILVAGQGTEERVPRGLIVSRADPIFAGQRDNECTGRNGEIGSCHSRRQCRQGGGSTSGQCGFASGVCCVRTLAFNETSQMKRTVLIRESGDSTVDYNYAIMAANRRICQLRIDFRVLNIAQPVLTAQAAGSTAECSEESLTVNDIRLCGHSRDQHIYVPLSQASNPIVRIRAHVASDNSAGNWNILATQLECQPGRMTPTGTQTRTNSWSYTREDRPEEFDYEETNGLGRQSQMNPRSTAANDAVLVAPAGCLQFYPNITGTVSTFNFDDANEDNHLYLPNMNYAICFNQPGNEQLRLNFESFSMSVRTPVTAPADPVDNACVWSGAQPADVNQDYLQIPRLAYRQNPTTVASFYCGTSLDGIPVSVTASPFVMHFSSDNFVDTALNVEKGFRFTYRLA